MISLQLKKEVIEASDDKSLAELSKEFNLPRSSIQNIVSNKETILSAIDDGSESKRAWLKTAKHENLEEAVLRWIKLVRSKNVAVSGPETGLFWQLLPNKTLAFKG